jgi:hypothetical protein
MLGARPGIDLLVIDGMVGPGEGGISVSPDDPRRLPSFRRPPELDGTGRDPVFAIDEQDLGPDLIYRPDPRNPDGHGFIEPVRPMPFEVYQQALIATQSAWRRYRP